MDAARYNNIRRIIFSAANDPAKGCSVARQWLNQTYRAQLEPRCYVGLSAELSFYERHRKEFGLTVAGDMGEHADFAGIYGGSATRFDVTTNLAYKRFRDYEPFIGEGIRYQIALLDQASFEIVDVFDLAFNRCGCGGHLIPFVTVFESDSGLAMNVCSGCKSVVEIDNNDRQTSIGIREYVNNALNTDATDDSDRIYTSYSIEQYKYLRKKYDENLMGIAFPHYSNLVGYWGVEFTFLNKVIEIDLSGQLLSDDWVRESLRNSRP